ncbi:hypothetical protein Pfo_025387 [Paulownia fortunei]|nr:hypothetical protein Pfo_025387 [Paulownia fortunei]
MNHDEKFQQRWEFRRKEVDGDTSSDDSRSNSPCEPADKKHKLVTDLVLLENDEANDTPGCQRHDKLDTYNSVLSPTVEAAEKKIKSSKKKNVVQKKSGGCSVKENKRNKNLNTKEMVMLKDLKIFADSLIHELTDARENMFAHMREEMRKLVASRSKKEPIKKNVRCSRKNKVRPQKGVEAGVKPQNCSGGAMDRNVKSNVASDACKFPKAVAEAVKHDQVPELTTTNELQKGDILRVATMAHMNLANGSDQVVSSSYLTLPTVLPKPQFQNHRNRMPLNNHIPPGVPMNNSVSEMVIGKLMDDKKNYHPFAEFQPEERFGSFSHICHKSVGLLGQNCSQTASLGVGFPIPLNHGTDNGSNMSSLTYSENSFMDSNKVGPRMNGSIVRFPWGSPASSERIFLNNMSSNMPRKTDGQFVSVRPQDLKDGQFYMTGLRNEQ